MIFSANVESNFYNEIYLFLMQKKNLLDTNPYLRDPIECDAWLIRSAVSSSAIEGVAASAFNVIYPATKKKIKVSKVSRRSARLPR